MGAGCLVPLAAGGAGIVRGAAMLKGVHPPLPVDLESHFAYLSGLLLGIGLAFAWCIPAIERRGPVFRALGLIVIVGGLGRLVSLLRVGPPSVAHLAALGARARRHAAAAPLAGPGRAALRQRERMSVKQDRRAAGPEPGDPS